MLRTILLIASVILNVFFGMMYDEKKDLANSYKDDLEASENNIKKIEREAMEYYQEGNEKIENIKAELFTVRKEKEKLGADYNEINKSLDTSIKERKKIEEINLNLERENKMKDSEIRSLQSELEEKEKLIEELKKIQEENQVKDLSSFDNVKLLGYFLDLENKIAEEAPEESLKKYIQEIKEYEKSTNKQTNRIIYGYNKISVKNLKKEIEKLKGETL